MSPIWPNGFSPTNQTKQSALCTCPCLKVRVFLCHDTPALQLNRLSTVCITSWYVTTTSYITPYHITYHTMHHIMHHTTHRVSRHRTSPPHHTSHITSHNTCITSHQVLLIEAPAPLLVPPPHRGTRSLLEGPSPSRHPSPHRSALLSTYVRTPSPGAGRSPP